MENIENSLVSDQGIGKVERYITAWELVSYKVRDNLLKATGVTVLLGEKVGTFLVTALGDLSQGEDVCFIHWGQQHVTHCG